MKSSTLKNYFNKFSALDWYFRTMIYFLFGLIILMLCWYFMAKGFADLYPNPTQEIFNSYNNFRHEFENYFMIFFGVIATIFDYIFVFRAKKSK